MNLQNLVNYCKDNDIDIFSGVTVPAPLNKDTLISAIMIRCGLLTPVYNEPYTFINATKYWFDSKQWTFSHLINIINAEYSPIENVDRYDEHTTTGGFTDQESGSEATETQRSGTDETTHTVSAFNTDSFQNDSQTAIDHGEKIDNGTTFGKNVKHDTNEHFVQHLHGNIGVTSNQQLINQELELLAKFDIYKYIAEQFENDNMIMLY